MPRPVNIPESITVTATRALIEEIAFIVLSMIPPHQPVKAPCLAGKEAFSIFIKHTRTV